MRILPSVVAAVLALGLAAPAAAATIDVSDGFTSNGGGPSLYEAVLDFTLPTGFTNAVLTITNLQVDDRGILFLNGVAIDEGGIFGPGDGQFDDGSGLVAHTFVRGNGARNVVVDTGFLTGLNSLRLIVNDTNAGIFGSLVNGPGGPSNTTSYFLVGEVTYDPPVAGIPEPSTWALMIAGFGLAGATLRSRRLLAA